MEHTLADFFQSRFGRPHLVKWWQTLHLAKPNLKNQIWLCNPYLNAIFVPKVSKQTLTPVIQEFSRSTKLWRSIFPDKEWMRSCYERTNDIFLILDYFRRLMDLIVKRNNT